MTKTIGGTGLLDVVCLASPSQQQETKPPSQSLFVGVIAQIASRVLSPVVNLAIEYLISKPVSTEPRLIKIWELMRAIADTFVLLSVSVMGLLHIFRGESREKHFSLKVYLPRIIGVAPCMNASLAICRGVESIVYSLTTTVVKNTDLAEALSQLLSLRDLVSVAQSGYGGIVLVILAAVMLVLLIILLLIYYLRLVGLWFLTILSPFAMLCAIDDRTIVFTKHWTGEYLSLLFIQLGHALSIAIFTAFRPFKTLESIPYIKGINQLVAMIALLIFMIKMPGFVRSFVHRVCSG